MPLPTAADEVIVESVRFPADGLMLEGRLAYPSVGALRGAAVIAGPHPLLGGDMRNNVVDGLVVGLASRGHTALAFNYRGVGGSDGEPPDVARHLGDFWESSHVSDEPAFQDDLRSAAGFLRNLVGRGTRVAGVGYSFGCSIVSHALANRNEPAVLIAPTIGTHDYRDFVELANPLLVIAAESDFAADADRLIKWFRALRDPKRLLRGEWDDHFFRGHEDWLAQTVSDFIGEHTEIPE